MHVMVLQVASTGSTFAMEKKTASLETTKESVVGLPCFSSKSKSRDQQKN